MKLGEDNFDIGSLLLHLSGKLDPHHGTELFDKRAHPLLIEAKEIFLRIPISGSGSNQGTSHVEAEIVSDVPKSALP